MQIYFWIIMNPYGCKHGKVDNSWSGLSESNPKLYTKFEFYEIEIYKHLESIWIYKAKQFMFTRKQF